MRSAVSIAPTAVLAAMIRAMSCTVAMLPARSRPGSPSGVAAVPSVLAATDGLEVGLLVYNAGANTCSAEFLDADLVDVMHVVILPIVLGRGVSPWEGLTGVEDRFTVESVASTSGRIHQFWNRKV